MAAYIKDCIKKRSGDWLYYWLQPRAAEIMSAGFMIDDFEKPEFFQMLRLMEKKAPAEFFLLTGMSDFSHWKTEWREQIFAKMTEKSAAPISVLTKRPEILRFPLP